ncbi:MAG: methionyl-tRNA formyltransferase [Proteobacteria bacterium]|nr:methionyl-tRNA formyltransferase [Pseudomonadota bacterium]MBU4296091.1 methionyl-tRNA formyltransferase [Pseudomonadota bacterium]MCG2748027.1 methionyl-tRNA formyltransferase [Desulfobulbaceae bacterium]
MINKINRIIFMGTPDFAVPSLQALLDHKENVVAAVTQPDRPKGRGRKLSPPPVKILAENTGIPVLQPTKIRTEEYLDTIREFEPDLIIVTAYGRILPGPLLRLPPLGTINVHGSLLPKYRGAAPVQRAILKGEKETGITIMQMDEGMDTGDILLQDSLPIKADDTSATLAAKMARLGGRLLIEALELLRRDELPPTRQDNHLATEAPPLNKDEAEIDWTRSAFVISCLIRGLDPWPLAHTECEGQRLRLFSPSVISGEPMEPPGTLCRLDRDGMMIATGHDYLLVREVQREGAKRMPVHAFLQGRPLKTGIRFGIK